MLEYYLKVPQSTKINVKTTSLSELLIMLEYYLKVPQSTKINVKTTSLS